MSYCRPAGYSDEEDDDDEFEFSTDFQEYNNKRHIELPEGDEILFYRALQEDDVEGMKRMLANGFDINTPLSGGWSALMYACSLGSFPSVELLINSGANVNYNNELFNSLMALCNSTLSDEDILFKCFRLLVQQGVNVDATERHSCTALMYACKAGHTKLVKALVECNCDINLQDSEGWSALFHAVSEGREDIVRILLEAKARVDLIDRRRRSAFQLAIEKGYDHLGKLVCNKREKRRLIEEEKVSVDVVEKFKDPVLEMLSQLPSSNAKCKSGYSSDISKFLWAMGLGHFCKLFVSKNVQLNEFLLITDDQLKDLGIRFSIHRQRILNSIRKFHLHQWNKSSLGLKPRNQQMSVEDGVRLMYNVTKHLHVINATLNYTRTHQSLPVRNEVFKKCDSALHQLQLISNELRVSRQFANRLKCKENIEPVDLIKPVESAKQSRYIIPLLATILVGFVIWKNKYKCHFMY